MLYIIFTIIITLASVVSIVVICLQEGKSAGLSGSIAGGSDNYWSRNKGRSKEGKLERLTKIAAIVFIVAAIVLNIGLFSRTSAQTALNEAQAAQESVVDGSAEDASADVVEESEAASETEATK